MKVSSRMLREFHSVIDDHVGYLFYYLIYFSIEESGNSTPFPLLKLTLCHFLFRDLILLELSMMLHPVIFLCPLTPFFPIDLLVHLSGVHFLGPTVGLH